MQGRFKAILVDRDSYLLEVCRYVELNPVRAGMVERPGDWPWSSFLDHTGQREAPAWLDTPGLHACLMGTGEATTPAARREAARRYRELVLSAPDLRIWDEGLRQQIYLGDKSFVARMQAQLARPMPASHDIPKAQRSQPKTFEQCMAQAGERAQALWLAHTEAGITMSALARELGLSVARISQLIGQYERARAERKT
ncbi:transposase [Paucibacter soli]|uniref:transposase n=1 Tax=Paucibacter soli TaxID=3133433 RepID=UPI0030A42E3C